MGTKSGETGDDLFQGQALYRHGRFFRHLLQPLPGGCRGFLVLYFDGRGPHQQIAVNRGGNQHPFSHSPRQLENGVIDITSRFLVQQQIVPPPGQNGKRLFGNQIVQFIGMTHRRR